MEGRELTPAEKAMISKKKETALRKKNNGCKKRALVNVRCFLFIYTLIRTDLRESSADGLIERSETL